MSTITGMASRISISSRRPSCRASPRPTIRPASCGWPGIPFQAQAADVASLVLLRVETDTIADVGAISPRLGGGGVRYDPLPSRLVSQRRRLRFIYYDGKTLGPLPLAEVRALSEWDGPHD